MRAAVPEGAVETTLFVAAHRAGTVEVEVESEFGSGSISIEAHSNHRVFAEVSGLAGSGLVLVLDGAWPLPLEANGTVSFPTWVSQGSPWTVAIESQPTAPGQSCTVQPTSGTIAHSDATVHVVCGTARHSFGGLVESLAGDGLVLVSHDQERLSVVADGPFAFSSRPDGEAWTIAVHTQPSPTELCTVQGGQGELAGADATDAIVHCTSQVRLGGTVSGLAGQGLVLQHAGRDLAVSGPWTFPGMLDEGAAYAVTVEQQPTSPRQTCTLDGQGVAGQVDLSLPVTCVTDAFAVGGTVSGLDGSLTLSQGAQALTVGQDGPFSFVPLDDQTAFDVQVAAQPAGQRCEVTSGAGVLAGSDYRGVSVQCRSTFTIGGTVSGASFAGLELRLNGQERLAVEAGTFTFAQPVLSGGLYHVVVVQQPAAQWCSVTGGTGLALADVTSVAVACVPTYALGVVVTGSDLEGLVLDLDGRDRLRIDAEGAYTFATRYPGGQAFTISVLDEPEHQRCSVSGGSGEVGTTDVSATVDCVPTWAIGGTASGYEAGGLVLGLGTEELAIQSDTFTFAQRLVEGDDYDVLLAQEPANAECTLTGGSGTVGTSDVQDVVVECVNTQPVSLEVLIVGLSRGDYTLTAAAGGVPQTAQINGRDQAVTFASLAFPGVSFTIGLQGSGSQTCSFDATSGILGVTGSTVTLTCAGATAIRTPDDLALLDGSSGRFYLANDLDLTGLAYPQIGTFSGELGGRGRAILGLRGPLMNTLSGTGWVGHLDLIDVDIDGQASNVGALAGLAVDNAQVFDVHATGSIVGNSVLGGLVGYLAGSGTSMTRVSADVDVWGILANPYVGGLVGYNFGSLSQCIAHGEVNGGSGSFVGGIVGRNAGSVQQCAATGFVSGHQYVGGGIGYNDDSGASPVVRDCYSRGDVWSTASAGGFAGLAGPSIHSYIERVYAAGTVSSLSAGGLCPSAHICYYFQSSYWDIDVGPVGSNGGGTGLTTQQMFQQASYVGWDFATVWQIDEGNDYPTLRGTP